MSVTLITSVPGGGKTVFAVWDEIRPASLEKRVVYTAAIPELKFDHIPVSYEFVKKWHEYTWRDGLQCNPFIPDEERERDLVNVAHGALIVIDEAQYCWPSAGSKLTEDIKHLTMHRKYGLDFVLITQAPHLIHKDVLAVVDRHIHIRVAWHGRHMFEWPEYCSTPRAMSSKLQATKKKFALPKQAFGTYRSASLHVGQRKKAKPFGVYIFPLIFLALPFAAYNTYSNIFNKEKPEVIQSETEQPIELSQSNPAPMSLPIPAPEPMPAIPQSYTLVSNLIDWSRVASCIANQKTCICYGRSAERLVIPPETCRKAVEAGWPNDEVKA